jgi:hypothetical protein
MGLGKVVSATEAAKRNGNSILAGLHPCFGIGSARYLGDGLLADAWRLSGFPYYDPLLMRIFGVGGVLSLSGLILGVGGVWRTSSLRWHAPISAIATLAFWIAAAIGE